MNPVARALWNPIVAKEYRARMRTWRSPFAITVYVVLLGGIGWLVFSAIANNTFGSGLSNYGQTLFTFLILEKIKGRPLSAKTQTIAQFVGMAVLLCVFLLVTYQDIARLTFMR